MVQLGHEAAPIWNAALGGRGLASWTNMLAKYLFLIWLWQGLKPLQSWGDWRWAPFYNMHWLSESKKTVCLLLVFQPCLLNLALQGQVEHWTEDLRTCLPRRKDSGIAVHDQCKMKQMLLSNMLFVSTQVNQIHLPLLQLPPPSNMTPKNGPDEMFTKKKGHWDYSFYWVCEMKKVLPTVLLVRIQIKRKRKKRRACFNM